MFPPLALFPNSFVFATRANIHCYISLWGLLQNWRVKYVHLVVYLVVAHASLPKVTCKLSSHI